MVSKVKVAFLLLLVTLVPVARARSDDDAMLDFLAFDTLTAAPSRNLRSIESVTTTTEGNGEERIDWSELFAKLMPKKETVPLNSETEPLLKTKINDIKALKEESEKIKMPQEESKNKLSVYEVIKKWWASVINLIFHKDDEVKRLIKIVEGEYSAADITRITTILRKKHLQRWYNMKRSAEDIHHLFGLRKSFDLYNSPLVWIWLEYAIWVGKTPLDTVKVFEKYFGSDALIARMLEDIEVFSTFKMKDFVPELRGTFLPRWIERERNLNKLRKDLQEAHFADERIQHYETLFKNYDAE